MHPKIIKRKSNRVPKACVNCRQRKQGCDSERPCKRCVSQGVPCVEAYPQGKRKKSHQHYHFKRRRNDDELVPRCDEESDCDEHSDSSDEPLSDYSEISSPVLYQADENEEVSDVDPSVSSSSETLANDPVEPRKRAPSKAEQNYARYHLLSFSSSDERFDGSLPGSPSMIFPQDDDTSCKLTVPMLLPFFFGSIAHFGPNQEVVLDDDCICALADRDLALFSDLPFQPHKSDLSPYIEDNAPIVSDEQYTNPFFRDCWRSCIQQMQTDERVKSELLKAKDRWREILLCLRQISWDRAQSELEDLMSGETSVTFGTQSAPMVFWSGGGRIQFANEAFCDMLGYTIGDLRANKDQFDSKPGIHNLFRVDDAMRFLKKQIDAQMSPPQSAYQMDLRLISKSRREIKATMSVSNLADSFGTPVISTAHFQLHD